MNTLLSPLAKSTVHVTVRLKGFQTPLSEALTKVKPSSKVSTTTTCLASTTPLLLSIIVYSILSPKLGAVLLTSLVGIISGTVTSTEAVLSPTVTSLVKTPYSSATAVTVKSRELPAPISTTHVTV